MKLRYKRLLSVLLTITVCASLIVYQAATVKAAPVTWDRYADMGGIDSTIYSSQQSIMNTYNDSYTLKPGDGETAAHGASSQYTNLTIDSTTKTMSKWFVSGYGPFLNYATNNVGNAENISIDWNNYNNTYSNANYAYIGSNQADLAEGKSVAMMNYNSSTLLPVLINSNSSTLSSAVTGAIDSHNINNLVILGGTQRFSDIIGIGDKYNMVRIGGVDRNDTYTLLNYVESGNKASFYNPSKPTTDSNGVVCDIPDSVFKPKNIAIVQGYLNSGDFASAVSYVLSMSQGSTANIQGFNYSALIGCGGKFLKVFYVNYQNGFSYGVYQYMGTQYFNPVNPTPSDGIAPTINLTVPSQAVAGDDVPIIATSTSKDPTVTSLQNTVSSGANVSGSNPIIGQQTFDAADTNKSFTSTGLFNFADIGMNNVMAVAVDNNGKSAITTKAINIIKPTPIVRINQTGTLKENRKIIIDMSSSSGGSRKATIDWTKGKCTVSAVNGASMNDVRIQAHTEGSTDGAVLYDPTKSVNKPLDGLQQFDMTCKKAGDYQITCTLTNNYGVTATSSITFTVIADAPPKAGLAAPTTFIRDHFDPNKFNGLAYAIIPMTDTGSGDSGCYSTDGDTIDTIGWFIDFDSDNNDKPDDSWYPFNGSTGKWDYSTKYTYDQAKNFDISNYPVGCLHQVTLEATHVGHYFMGIICKEKFGQDYIPQFVTDADRKIGKNFD